MDNILEKFEVWRVLSFIARVRRGAESKAGASNVFEVKKVGIEKKKKKRDRESQGGH